MSPRLRNNNAIMGWLVFPTIRLVHAWSGLVLSILLAVLSLSGSLLVFKDDYLRAVFQDAAVMPVTEPETIGAAVERIERDFGTDNISYIALAHPKMSLHRIVLRDGRAAYARQDGEPIEEWETNGRLEDWIFHLHHYLFLGEFGKYLAGVAAIATVLMAATGVYLVLPFLKSFRWRLWPRSMNRRGILANHRELGVVFALPIILITLTGAGMVFFKQTSAVLSAVTFSEPRSFEPPAGIAGDIDWTTALPNARSKFPEAQLRLLIWPRGEDGTASIRMRLPSEWHQNGRTYAYINPATSEVVAVRNGNTLSAGERAANAVYPLHSTGVGGRAYDILAGLTGIALTILGLLASWSYLRLLLGRRSSSRAARA